MPIRIEDPCDCGNEDPVQFRQLRNSDGTIIGKFCKSCKTEWLALEYLSSCSNYDTPGTVIDAVECLFKNQPFKLEENRAFQIRSARTKIDLEHFADILKPGDHITWHRKIGYWHHSIVHEINVERNEIGVIQWTDSDCRIKIIEESLPVKIDENALFNQMYRVDYPEEITKANDRELVLSRARSRIGDSGYGLFTDNCESFVTYCKTGDAKSHQNAWLKGKGNEILGGTLVTTIKASVKSTFKAIIKAVPKATGVIIPAELTEELAEGLTEDLTEKKFTKSFEAVGALIVIALETILVTCDIRKAYAERRNGNISRYDFVEVSTRRVVEGLCSAGLAISFSIILERYVDANWKEPFDYFGIVVGGIIGGILGGAVGRVIGTWFGSWMGKEISQWCKDGSEVKEIGDLKPGDYIVLNGCCLVFIHDVTQLPR